MIYNKYFLEFLNTFSCCNYSEIMCIVAAIFRYLVKRSSWHFRGSTVCFKVSEIKYLLWVMRVSIFQYSKICKFTYFIRQNIGKSFSRELFAQIYILQEIIFLVVWKIYIPIFDQCSTYGYTKQLVFTSNMFEKHLWKSDILS